MNPINIEYRFRLAEDKQEIFTLQFDAQSMELIGHVPGNLPQWTRLDFNQCPNCSLTVQTHPHCPLSVSLIDIVARFDHISSYEKTHIDVITNDRRISMDSTAQAGISSLMGLMIATSGCPHTVFLRPMARFHQPLAGEEETLYRAASMYLLAQYFLQKEGKTPTCDFEGLDTIYKNIQWVNEGIAERLKYASSSDLSANAVTKLDSYAKVISCFVQDKLENIRYLFAPYLEEHHKRL